MRYLIIVAAALHVVLGGVSQVAVRLPFLNPAGVTYLNGPAPAGLAAGPVGYAAAAPAAVGYAAAAPAAVGYAAAAPAAVGYAAAPVAVPTVHHVPGVADVPVTRIEAQPGVVQQQIDVAHPAVATRKFEVRRPAIQKQFYDIEERVVIRPAGSALVELDEPTSRLQRGPTVVSPVGPGAAVAAGPAVAAPAAVAAGPAYAPVVAATPAPVFVSSTPAPALGAYPGPAGPAPGAPAQFESDDSISVENPEFSARAAAAAQQQYESQQRAAAAQQQYEAQQRAAAQQQQYEAQQRAAAQQQQYEAQQRAAAQQQQQQQQYEAQQRAAAAAQHQAAGPLPSPQPEIRTNGAPLEQIARAQPLAGPDVVPSLRSIHPEENQANQQRLIQLLTARGGVTEVGFGRAGPAGAPVGDAGNVRARVLSATPAPAFAAPAGERVSTRRVVVSRPIETLQEVDVIEPVTKLHRVAVNTPTLFKTVRQDIARVPTTVPVLGKTIAHAAVPVGLYH
ncbi:uncharacterized protein LOC126298478 [Schistocerca gregaria]|uniref:uncharacterized protein LOC126298478 n=1 Tax=Schistocerca gregaria TaxID=7010 RepID=UPI00211F2390|nr:uncharacterized protein LOC126298478 [Schistocerca gregaria]